MGDGLQLVDNALNVRQARFAGWVIWLWRIHVVGAHERDATTELVAFVDESIGPIHVVRASLIRRRSE